MGSYVLLDVFDGQVAEHQRGSDGRTGAGVGVAHHGGRHVAGGIETRDHRAVRPQHPSPLVGEQSALGAEVARHDLHGVERGLIDHVQRGVRLHGGVRVVLVVGRLAPVEVLVDPHGREAVEPRDGGRQRVGRYVDLLSERLERRRLLDRAVLVPAAGEGLPRAEPGEEVAVAVALVDDHPARHVADAGLLALVHLLHGLDVRQRLVHVAPAGLVDHERAGQVALRETEPGAVRQRDRGAPPGVVHDVGRRACRDAGLEPARRC